MDWTDILKRIEEGEGRTTEFTRGIGDLSAVGKAICAFANTGGGVIILGASARVATWRSGPRQGGGGRAAGSLGRKPRLVPPRAHMLNGNGAQLAEMAW